MFEKAFPTVAKMRAKRKPGKSSSPQSTAAGQSTKYKPSKLMLPRIDLLPPELVLAVRRRAVRFVFFVIGMTIVMVAGLMYAFQVLQVQIVNSDAELAQRGVAQAQQELDRFGETASYMAEVQQREERAATLTGDKFPYPSLMSDLSAALPPGATYKEITARPMFAAAATDVSKFVDDCGPKTDPFSNEAPAVSGCVTFSGTLKSRGSMRTMARDLRASGRYLNVYVASGTATTESDVPFQGSFLLLDAGGAQ